MEISSNAKKRPKVGIGVFVTSKNHPGCVLMGLRKGSATGGGLYALPGGHLEFGESWENCAIRETLEETGLTLKTESVKFCTVVNDIELVKNHHCVEIFMVGEIDTSVSEEPENVEPDKCEGWIWIDWNELPPDNKLFYSLVLLKDAAYSPFIKSTV